MTPLLMLFAAALAVCVIAILVMALAAYRAELREIRTEKHQLAERNKVLGGQVMRLHGLSPERRPHECHCSRCHRMRYLPPDILMELGLSSDCDGLDL